MTYKPKTHQLEKPNNKNTQADRNCIHSLFKWFIFIFITIVSGFFLSTRTIHRDDETHRMIQIENDDSMCSTHILTEQDKN